VQDAQRQAAARPQDPAAWAALTRARYQLATVGDNYDTGQNTYTAAGRAELQRAGEAWQKYLALNPKTPDDRIASLMVQAYSVLGKAGDAVRAQEVVTEARPTAATFAQLATFAYAAGQTRKVDLARGKALELAPKDQRTALKAQLDQAKAQGAGASGGSG
jgi:tetratricopeptide (TPR) repeat protein